MGRNRAVAVFPLVEDIGDLDWCPCSRRLTHRASTQVDRASPQAPQPAPSHLVTAPKMKFLRGLIVLVDHTAIAPLSWTACDNGGEDRFEIESRAHCLADFSKRFEFANRPSQLAGSRLQFLE